MAKVTSKLQVTVPKALAERFGIRPGDEIAWVAAGDSIRIVPTSPLREGLDTAARLRLFDQATARQRSRREQTTTSAQPESRGWSREKLYDRGSTG